jgi:RND family efflux transporter MFP subunit
MRPLTPILLAAATLLAGCDRHADSSAARPLPAIAVRTARVESVNLPQTRTLTATIHPVERATIAARIMGEVTAANFAVGQSVSADELVLTLAAPEIAARLAQARAALAQARREAARESALVRQNASAADTALAAEDRLHIAEAVATEAEALLAYTRVTAPFSGTITRKFVNTGDLASPGTTLFTLEATDHLRAELQVPASFAALPLGAEIAVQLSPDTAPIAARLAELSAAADPVTRTRLAKLDLPVASAARSGQLVRVLWPDGETAALLVPPGALDLFGQMERVFVVTPDHHAQLRLVKSAPAPGNRCNILSGLTAGENVVLDPAPTLRDGQPVTILP